MADNESTSGVTVLAHPGVDDATQRDVPVYDGAVTGGMHNPNRGVVDQSADVDFPRGDLAGEQYDTDEDVMLPRLEDREPLLWRRQYLVLPGPENYGMTDPTNDMFTHALGQGYRPIGDVRLESEENHPDGLHKILTFVVEVKPTKGDDDLQNTVAQVRAERADRVSRGLEDRKRSDAARRTSPEGPNDEQPATPKAEDKPAARKSDKNDKGGK